MKLMLAFIIQCVFLPKGIQAEYLCVRIHILFTSVSVLMFYLLLFMTFMFPLFNHFPLLH